MKVELQKIVRGDSEAAAKELAVQVLILQERKENSLLIETNRKALGKQGRRLNTNLILRLPDQLQTKVVNSYGDVRVEGRSADCELENSYGKITAANIRGDVSMKGQYQQIKATDIEGSVDITNRRASVIVRDVTKQTIFDIMDACSKETDFTFLGMKIPPQMQTDEYSARIERLMSRLGSVLLVRRALHEDILEID